VLKLDCFLASLLANIAWSTLGSAHAANWGRPVNLVVALQQDIIVRNHGTAVRQCAVDRLIEGIVVAGWQEIEGSAQR
jgi:hypothetical protein